MGKSADAGRVRLTVPADEEMLDVVRAAVRALCARVGLIDAEVEATRAAVGDAFLELVATTDADEVVLEADVTDFDLAIALAASGEERRVEARR